MSYRDYISNVGVVPADLVSDLLSNLDSSYLSEVIDYYFTITPSTTDPLPEYLAIDLSGYKMYNIVNGNKVQVLTVPFTIETNVPSVSTTPSTVSTAVDYAIHGKYLLVEQPDEALVLRIRCYVDTMPDELELTFLNVITNLMTEDVSSTFSSLQILSSLTNAIVASNLQAHKGTKMPTGKVVTAWTL